MFYDQNQSRIIMSYPALLAAYPDAGDLITEPARNALGLYLVHEQPPTYDPLTHTLALAGVGFLVHYLRRDGYITCPVTGKVREG